MSERENRAYFHYRRRTKTPHSVSWAGMAPKLTRPVASPKTHSPMAQVAAGMYMTYHYQAHTYIAQWREQARSDSVERAYIEKMGLGPFVNMNWADQNSAPKMQLIEEFINGAVHHPDRMEAEVDRKTCVINVALITRFLHLSIGDTAKILAEPELDKRCLIEYQGLEPKQPSGYSITQGHQGHILRKRVFIQTFMFKRKPTYISENAIRQWVSAEILASKGDMWGWALCMLRELVKDVKECKKDRTTICVSAEVLDRLLDLYFPHSTHPTQKAVVQHKDDMRRAKENERNRFNDPDYLILCRSPVRIVDEASPSHRTEPVSDTTDPLPTQEPAVLPTPGTQTSQPDKRPHPHPRDRAKAIATSQLKKQKTTTETPTRTPQCNLNFEEVTTDTSVSPASASTAHRTQKRLQARNQRGTETKQPPVLVPSTSTPVVQDLSTNDEDINHETTPQSPTPERPRNPTPAPTNMALVTYIPNPTYQPEPEMDRLKRMATEEEDPADPLRQHVAQVQQYQAAARLLQDAPVAHNRALWYVTDLKAALRSALNHHDNVRRELNKEQATTYELRHEIERHHHDAVARAKQLEEFEAELQKKLPKEKELQTLRATHQSLRDKVIELEGSVTDLQATNAEWAASYTQQQELITQMEASAKTTVAFINNRTRYFCRIMWKLVHVSRDYRDLLQTHHQLQDDLCSTQRHKKKLRIQAVVRIVTLQAQMRMLRHEAATAQQQLEFYRAQHLTTLILDDLSPTEEEEEDTELEDKNQMETIPYQENELDSDDEEMANPSDRPTYDLTIPLPYGREAPPPDDSHR